MSSEKAVATIDYGQRGLQIQSLEELYRFGQSVVKSGLAPGGYKTAEQVMVAVQAGAELGFAPIQSLQSIVVVNGKPTLMCEPALALVQRSGLLKTRSERFDGEGDTRSCRVHLVRVDGQSIERSFSIAEAKTAGLAGKQVWKSYPDRMLFARAMGYALRDLFPDVLRGFGIREEVQDWPAREVRDVTPRTVQGSGPDPLLAQLGSGQESMTIPTAQPEIVDAEQDSSGAGAPNGGERKEAVHETESEPAPDSSQGSECPECASAGRDQCSIHAGFEEGADPAAEAGPLSKPIADAIEQRVSSLVDSAQAGARDTLAKGVRAAQKGGFTQEQILKRIRDWNPREKE